MSHVAMAISLVAGAMAGTPSGPGDDFCLKAGPYVVTISIAWAHTVRSIVYAGDALGAATGFYGTVFSSAKGKYVGSGHTEGGKEQVREVSLEVDGRKLTPHAGQTYTGKQVRLIKTADLDRLRFVTVLELTPDYLVEYKQFEALAAQPVHQFALYAYCWSVNTREWTAELANGKMIDGSFSEDGGWRISDSVRWAAAYDPAAGKGVAMYHPELIPTGDPAGCRSGFWDVKERYHKYDVFLRVPSTIPRGDQSPRFTMVSACFTALPAAWREACRETVLELERDFPRK